MKRISAVAILILSMLLVSAAALAKTPVQALKDPVTNLSQHDQRIDAVLAQGSAAIPGLIALLDEKPDFSSRWGAKVTAMNILSEFKAQSALNPLKNMLENSNNLSAINNAARTIGRIGGNHAYKILADVLQNTLNYRYTLNEERQKAVIAGLGLCGNKKAVRPLTEVLNNPSNDLLIRIYAAGSLGLLGNQSGLDVAESGLNSADPYVNLAAIRALGIIGSPSSIPALTASTHPNADIVHRRAAALSIVQIKAAKLSGDAKVAFIQQQISAHHTTTQFIQWGTMKLKKINTPAAENALKHLSEQNGPGYAALRHAATVRWNTMAQGQ